MTGSDGSQAACEKESGKTILQASERLGLVYHMNEQIYQRETPSKDYFSKPSRDLPQGIFSVSPARLSTRYHHHLCLTVAQHLAH